MMALGALAGTALAEDGRQVTATGGGRLHLDFAMFDNDDRGTPNKDDTEIRRAWVDVSGKFFVVDYKAEADFSGDRVEVQHVYLSRSFRKAGKLTGVQFKQYFSPDYRTSSNYACSLARGYPGPTPAPPSPPGPSLPAHPGYLPLSSILYRL